MTSNTSSARRWLTQAAILFMVTAAPLHAADGVIEINQAGALAGGITDADDPGFPVTLGESGAYVLTGNLTVPDANTDAVEVSALNVSIDLNGFAILGPTICNSGVSTSCTNTGTGRGIYRAVPAFRNTTVRNGSIHGIGGVAIDLSFGAYVTEMQVTGNGGNGIIVGNGSRIVDNVVMSNGGNGIAATQGSEVSGNIVIANVGNGIETNTLCTISGNTVTDNMLVGIVASRGLVIDNTVAFNDGGGMFFSSTFVGYAGNVIQSNAGGNVTSGTEIGPNLCNFSPTCQ
jgi:hypothetical protein